jgi:hypothetical protein
MVDGPGDFRHPNPMLVRMMITLHRVALFAALTVALMATGFAHRMPNAQDEAVAFALQNGVSLSDICGDLGTGPHVGPDCEACRIAVAADLPPLTGTRIDLKLAVQAEVLAPRAAPTLVSAADPAHRPQGPPVA